MASTAATTPPDSTVASTTPPGKQGKQSLQDPKFTNALIHEKSPYLLQHAHNPVDWLPWGEEAFAKARKEGKVAFVSVGYATCHWCHVMAHESFENEDIAKILNEHFVPIKVDREERPDVDGAYMTFVQTLTGRGGWPMSVWLTPELQPIYGGTYYPPTRRYGSPGFADLLTSIAKTWKTNPAKVKASASHITDQLQAFAAQDHASVDDASQQNVVAQMDDSWYAHVYGAFGATFDDEWGGFSDAPKFPCPSILLFLTRFHVANRLLPSELHQLEQPNVSDATLHELAAKYRIEATAKNGVKARLRERQNRAQKALEWVEFTCEHMIRGGIHDHVGKGFHRYSTDTEWHVCHWEKMLYDQAQLAIAFTELHAITGKPIYAEAVHDICTYVSRDLRSPEGGFYCAEDADSLPTHADTHKKEGAFAVWGADELRGLLGDQYDVFAFMFGIEPSGNIPRHKDPHNEMTGKNALIMRHTAAETAKKWHLTESAVKTQIQASLGTLWEARLKRPKPHRDDKIIVSWNGLMIAAFAQAAVQLNRPEYLTMAQDAARFIQRHMWNPETNELIRSYREGPSQIGGFADDYAFLTYGLLHLYQADMDATWLTWARALNTTLGDHFFDQDHHVFYTARHDDTQLPLRTKADHDGAEPTASSVATWNMTRLGLLEEDGVCDHYATSVLAAFWPRLRSQPQSMPFLAAASYGVTQGVELLVVALPSDAQGTALSAAEQDFLRTAQAAFHPHRLVVRLNPALVAAFGETASELRSLAQTPVTTPTAWLCRHQTCGLPLTSLDALKAAVSPA